MKFLIDKRTLYIVEVREDDAVFTAKEQVDPFAILDYECTIKEANELITGGYRWDNNRKVFRHEDTGLDYTPDLAIDATDAPEIVNRSEEIADSLEPDWRSVSANDVCAFFAPAYLFNGDHNDIRKYFYRRFRIHIGLIGVKRLLACIRYGDYGQFSDTGNELVRKTRVALINKSGLSEEDKIWLRWIWRLS